MVTGLVGIEQWVRVLKSNGGDQELETVLLLKFWRRELRDIQALGQIVAETGVVDNEVADLERLDEEEGSEGE